MGSIHIRCFLMDDDVYNDIDQGRSSRGVFWWSIVQRWMNGEGMGEAVVNLGGAEIFCFLY